jgi:L-lactate utilization protein LutB
MIVDQNKKDIIAKKVARTIENLKKNNMRGFFVENKGQAVAKVQELIAEGSTVAWGGSESLYESGVIDHLRSGKYLVLDRDRPDLSMEQLRAIFIRSFDADFYLCSSNAITEDGELYNVDGNSNRVAAMLFGPKNVIVVAGYNKLVRDVDEAVARVKSIAAPANCVRLNRNTPCIHTGHCMTCKSPDRICSNYVVMAQQKHIDRIKVIIVGEELGY